MSDSGNTLYDLLYDMEAAAIISPWKWKKTKRRSGQITILQSVTALYI